MATTTRTGPYTFADFLELIHDNQKADLIDGAIYWASPENTEHNDVLFWLGVVLRQFVDERRLGTLTINKVAYRLTEKNAPEPDLAFVSQAREQIVCKGYVDGAPDLAVEFVSPDSVERDYETKRRRYEEAGVSEYWIIDLDEQRATFLVRGPDGYVETPIVDGVYHSRVIPGFPLNIGWLWQRPLPSSLNTTQKLLADADAQGR